jgi:hypothetical protein
VDLYHIKLVVSIDCTAEGRSAKDVNEHVAEAISALLKEMCLNGTVMFEGETCRMVPRKEAN